MKLMFAAQRKPFWRYFVKEILTVALLACLFVPLMFLVSVAEDYHGLPKGLGLALVLLAFAVFWAIKGYRKQE